ncbi:acetamidase/formamidase family protein [Anaerobacillus isosaccharinicus]|uniref:Acetamidase n=1 Tax=Anaerobacillus isosaccharinicus TaxID=1532552 RepID=A0A1S2MG77_9BACI|nr:acetamidase/formamidase family protein [Anaerobacillus isosaccharinicus]MBA5586685.1 acetamidase/formamidase family protein [Anaerobacillus isosaccharinicus]QOY35085.1 acetamidase/formamidase family protein [Anaerobacillus isosaccharinicus]
MEKISCQSVIYDFNKCHEPIKNVSSGTTLEISTYDCFENQIQSENMEISALDWDRVNPATGPIYVDGAEVGDVLKVKIEKLEIGDQGVMVVGPNLGVMGYRFTEMKAKIIPIKNGKAMFNDLVLPLNPMIGVIGVAPAGEGVTCGTPGAHGGNMDNKMVREGVTMYFPVFVEGALFGLGDFHAAMGDGEISVSGIEVPGKATVTLEVLKGKSLQEPMLENDEVVTQIASAKTLDEAAKLATELMIDQLVELTEMSIEEVTMLMSAVGQVEVCQIVDPLITARFVVPKWLLKQLNVSFF